MPIARYILLTMMLTAALGSRAQEGGDTQARIDYAYQTEDGNSLASLIQNLTTQVKSDPADIALRYHLAHAQYRFGQLSHERHASGAEAAFSDCIDELKPVIEKNVKSAEGLVLQAACDLGLAGSRMLEAVLLRTRAADRLKAALKLEPRNPRAVLLSAMQECATRSPDLPRVSGLSPRCSRRRNFSNNLPAPATTRRAGDMPRPIWRSAKSCRCAATIWARAIGLKRP